MVEQLANRLTKVKSDLSGWIKLYRSYKVLNNQEKAINAIRTATEISPDKIDLKIILLKELMPSDAKPQITNEIEILIQDILTLESKNIEALFFKGLIFFLVVLCQDLFLLRLYFLQLFHRLNMHFAEHNQYRLLFLIDWYFLFCY